MSFLSNALLSVQDFFVSFGSRDTVLASKMEHITYRPGRFDLTLLLDPHRQTEFEREWIAARKIRAEELIKDKEAYERKLTELLDRHNAAKRAIEAEHDRTMRMLAIKYGTVSEQEPLVLRESTMSRAIGPAGESAA